MEQSLIHLCNCFIFAKLSAGRKAIFSGLLSAAQPHPKVAKQLENFLVIDEHFCGDQNDDDPFKPVGLQEKKLNITLIPQKNPHISGAASHARSL